MRCLNLILFFLFSIGVANAHQTSTSFISFEPLSDYTVGEWKVSVDALNAVSPMDINNDGIIKWLEIRKQKNQIFKLLNKSVSVETEVKGCDFIFLGSDSLAAENILDMNYVVVPFRLTCPTEDLNTLSYQFYFNLDNDHKVIVSLSTFKKTVVHMLSADNSLLMIKSDVNKSFLNIVSAGVWHILIGFEHIIFLLILIIGIIFARKKINYQSIVRAYEFKPKLMYKSYEIIKVSAAFTLAHSITLALAALKIVSIPAQLIESLIAMTLVFAAIHNMRWFLPLKVAERMAWPIWKMAFLFGLIHGFGFVSVLTELNLTVVNTAATLFAFNIGVELGQIGIILGFVLGIKLLSLIFTNKNNELDMILPASSGLVIVLGLTWFVERSFDITVF